MFKIPYFVTNSIDISSSIEDIHDVLTHFKNWPKWSPWLCMDKQAKLQYFGEDGTVNSGYHWQGQWVGEGRLSHQQIEANRLTMRLEFVKPWKSVCQVGFKLRAVNDRQTEVTWLMDGELPFWLFFMKADMQAYIRMDYQRGLLMLKDLLETGSVNSDTEVVGTVKTDSTNYVGLRRRCAIADIENSMTEVFAEIKQRIAEAQIESNGHPFTLYHDWNLKKQLCDYTIAYPVDAGQNISDSELIQAERPAFKALKLIHTGDYKHLGNAWMTGYSRFQNDKSIKADKKQPGFEVYTCEPANTENKQGVTEIFIAMK